MTDMEQVEDAMAEHDGFARMPRAPGNLGQIVDRFHFAADRVRRGAVAAPQVFDNGRVGVPRCHLMGCHAVTRNSRIRVLYLRQSSFAS